MKNIFFIILFIISVQFSFSQLYTSAGSEIYVSADDFLYSNENIENNGTVTLKNNSSLIIDADLVNNSQIIYQDGTDKAIFQIGSGESTSNQPQDIQFNANITEEAPFIRLNKLAETATDICAY